MGLADKLLAGLQFDHADAERCADHRRQPGAIGVEHAAITTDRRLVMLRHPFLADLNRVLRRLRELDIGLGLESRRHAGIPVEGPAWRSLAVTGLSRCGIWSAESCRSEIVTVNVARHCEEFPSASISPAVAALLGPAERVCWPTSATETERKEC